MSSMNILVATPGRLLQHMDTTPGFDTSQLQILVGGRGEGAEEGRFSCGEWGPEGSGEAACVGNGGACEQHLAQASFSCTHRWEGEEGNLRWTWRLSRGQVIREGSDFRLLSPPPPMSMPLPASSLTATPHLLPQPFNSCPCCTTPFPR